MAADTPINYNAEDDPFDIDKYRQAAGVDATRRIILLDYF